MTTIEDRLTEAARRLRQDIDDRVDIEDAILGTTSPSRIRPPLPRSRSPIRVAAAVLLVVVASAAAVVISDGNDERTVVANGPDTTATDPPPATAPGVAFERLGAFPTSAFPDSIAYVGLADAFADQWAAVGGPKSAPTVDFDQRAVLVFTTTQWGGCPQELVSLNGDGASLTPVFAPRPDPSGCGSGLAAVSYFLAVDRADLSSPFTLVLAGALDGSYPELRLEVDIALHPQYLASSAPPGDTGDAPAPDGPDLRTPAPGREITFDGVAEVRLDQVLDPSAVTTYEGGGPCGYWGPNEPSHDGDEPLTGLVAGAGSARPTVLDIMVRANSRYRTASGVGIGTTLGSLQRVYGADLVVDRADGWENPTDGLLASYTDVAAIRNGERALTFYLRGDVVEVVKVSHADFWGDDEGCA